MEQEKKVSNFLENLRSFASNTQLSKKKIDFLLISIKTAQVA